MTDAAAVTIRCHESNEEKDFRIRIQVGSDVFSSMLQDPREEGYTQSLDW